MQKRILLMDSNLAVVGGTDLSSDEHGYTPVYDACVISRWGTSDLAWLAKHGPFQGTALNNSALMRLSRSKIVAVYDCSNNWP